jgi:CubicO group peptidase (beta-lactamase class C family)
MRLPALRSILGTLAALATLANAPQAQSRQGATGQAAAAVSPATLDSLRARVRHIMDSTHVPSLSVAVASHGKIVWEEGFGFADVEHKVPATPQTLYSMASISKPITATGMMRLVEAGKIRLDNPANDYLGSGKITGLAGDAAAATVRRVMSHTAGLPLHYHFFYAMDGGDERPSMDEAIDRYGIVMFPPGTVYNYSNLGYGIVEQMIAHTSGKPYEDFMRTEVFEPLGLTHTTIGTGAGISNSAVRYDDQGKPIPYYDFDHRGASAVYTSAHDLVRFGMFHLKDHLKDQQRILADSTIDLMHRSATTGAVSNGRNPVEYGLGWAINTEFGVRRFSHTGGMPGVATILALYPSEDLAVVVLANQSSPAPFLAATDIAAAFLPPAYGAALAAERAKPRPEGGRPAFAAPAELIGEWEGTIRTYQGMIPISLTIKNDDVHVRFGERDALWTVLNNASFRNGLLSGRFLGTMPTDDARRHPHEINILFRLDGGSLRGWAAAVATDPGNTFALSSYADLTRKTASTTP